MWHENANKNSPINIKSDMTSLCMWMRMWMCCAVAHWLPHALCIFFSLARWFPEILHIFSSATKTRDCKPKRQNTFQQTILCCECFSFSEIYYLMLQIMMHSVYILIYTINVITLLQICWPILGSLWLHHNFEFPFCIS